MGNKFAIIIILLLSGINLSGADTLRIEITRKNFIGPGNEKTGEITVSQKFYAADGLLIREVRYDDNTGGLAGYTFYFHRDSMLSSEEIYNEKDELLCVIRHYYDKKGNKTLTTSSYPDEISDRVVRKYNSSGLLISEKVFKNRATASVKKNKYNSFGIIVSSTAKLKPAADTAIKVSAEVYDYDDQGRITAVNVSTIGLKGEKGSFIFKYGYNDNGALSSIQHVDSNGKVVSEKTFTYYATGTLRELREKDENGLTIYWFVKEYRTNVMNVGTQKSVIDGLVYPGPG